MCRIKNSILCASLTFLISCAVDNSDNSNPAAKQAAKTSITGTWTTPCELQQIPVIFLEPDNNEVIYQIETLTYFEGNAISLIETYSDAGCSIPYESQYPEPEPINYRPYLDEINVAAWVAEYYPFVSYEIGEEIITVNGAVAKTVDFVTENGEIYKTIFSIIDGGHTLLLGKSSGEMFFYCLVEKEVLAREDSRKNVPLLVVTDFVGLTMNDIENATTDGIAPAEPEPALVDSYTCSSRPGELDYGRPIALILGL